MKTQFDDLIEEMATMGVVGGLKLDGYNPNARVQVGTKGGKPPPELPSELPDEVVPVGRPSSVDFDIDVTEGLDLGGGAPTVAPSNDKVVVLCESAIRSLNELRKVFIDLREQFGGKL